MFYFLTGLLVAVGIFGYVMAIRASLYCESRVWKNSPIKRNWLAPTILGGLLSPSVVFVGIVLGGNVGGGIFARFAELNDLSRAVFTPIGIATGFFVVEFMLLLVAMGGGIFLLRAVGWRRTVVLN